MSAGARLVELRRLSSAPAQWVGRLEDGRDVYLRVRWGHLDVRTFSGPLDRRSLSSAFLRETFLSAPSELRTIRVGGPLLDELPVEVAATLAGFAWWTPCPDCGPPDPLGLSAGFRPCAACAPDTLGADLLRIFDDLGIEGLGRCGWCEGLGRIPCERCRGVGYLHPFEGEGEDEPAPSAGSHNTAPLPPDLPGE